MTNAKSKLTDLYEAISIKGFTNDTLQKIGNYIKDIQNGTENFDRYDISEHAGLCTAGPIHIGATIIACYAEASLTASRNAESSEAKPANWEIDEEQEKQIEAWARASSLWYDDSEKQIISEFGPQIAQGAESKVYYKEGSIAVVKQRTSIYSTLLKALDAITIHNMLFPETAMRVVGFTRDTDNLLRIILSSHTSSVAD